MTQLLKTVWKDVRRGENIDLYVTVALSIVLVFLSEIHVVPADQLLPLNLTVLALLAVALVGNRHRLDDIVNQSDRTPRRFFHVDMPETVQGEIGERIERAKELRFVGLSLERTLHLHSDRIERRLREGAHVKVVIGDPEACISRCVAKRERTGGRADEGFQRTRIRSTLKALDELGRRTGGNLEVRLTDYPISRGGIIVDPDTPDGVLYVWDSGFKTARSVKFVLRASDREWYTYFKDEFCAVWDNGAPYHTNQGKSGDTI